MNIQPILQCKMVIVRPLLNEDYLDLYEVARDPLIWAQHHSHRYRKDEFDAFFKESVDSGGAMVVIDNETGSIIGSSRFKLIEGAPDAVEIGWSFLSRNYWGGTYNRAFKTLMIEHVFSAVSNVIFLVNEANVRSQRAVEKLGGRRSTDFRKPYYVSPRDEILTYLINKCDWALRESN